MPHPLQYLRRVQGWVRLVSHGRATRESMEYASHREALGGLQARRLQRFGAYAHDVGRRETVPKKCHSKDARNKSSIPARIMT